MRRSLAKKLKQRRDRRGALLRVLEKLQKLEAVRLQLRKHSASSLFGRDREAVVFVHGGEWEPDRENWEALIGWVGLRKESEWSCGRKTSRAVGEVAESVTKVSGGKGKAESDEEPRRRSVGSTGRFMWRVYGPSFWPGYKRSGLGTGRVCKIVCPRCTITHVYLLMKFTLEEWDLHFYTINITIHTLFLLFLLKLTLSIYIRVDRSIQVPIPR